MAWGLIFIAALACACIYALGHPDLTRATNLPLPVERASLDDCAIIVEIGKANTDWGSTPSNLAFFPEWDRPGGGIYLETCPWRALGVAEPRLGGANSKDSFFITRPTYDVQKTHASADFHKTLASEVGARPFMTTQTCSLHRQGRRWVLDSCRTKAIT